MTYPFTEQLTEINHQSVLEMFWMKYFLYTVRCQGQIIYGSGRMSLLERQRDAIVTEEQVKP